MKLFGFATMVFVLGLGFSSPVLACECGSKGGAKKSCGGDAKDKKSCGCKDKKSCGDGESCESKTEEKKS